MTTADRVTIEGRQQLIPAEEAAAILGVSRARIYDLIRLGLVPGVRLGRSVRVSVSELEWLIHSGGRRLPTERDGGENRIGAPQ